METDRSHIDLFSGIGGFAYGLEMSPIAFVECEPHLQRVLRRHWPNVPIYRDVKTFKPSPRPFIMTGGFPCQDISRANTTATRKGIYGQRSGLWFEFARLIDLSQPKYVLIENVYDLVSRGLGVVLRDLAYLRYDATWTVIDSQYCGVPQRRRRVYILGVRDGITRGTDPLANSIRATERVSRSAKIINGQHCWDFQTITAGCNPVAFFTRQRSNEFTACGLSSTLTKRDWKSYTDLVLHSDGSIRRLSTTERMRLQGFPDDWLENCGLTVKEKYAANGMTVNAVRWLSKKIIEYDERYGHDNTRTSLCA